MNFAWTTGPTTGGYNIAATAHEGTEGVTATAAAEHHHHIPRSRHAEHHGIHQRHQRPGHQQLSRPTASVCVSVTALNRNTNAATIDTVTATVTSSSGDSETLTLIETGTNTGIFTEFIRTSTTLVGHAAMTARLYRAGRFHFDGELHRPERSELQLQRHRHDSAAARRARREHQQNDCFARPAVRSAPVSR